MTNPSTSAHIEGVMAEFGILLGENCVGHSLDPCKEFELGEDCRTKAEYKAFLRTALLDAIRYAVEGCRVEECVNEPGQPTYEDWTNQGWNAAVAEMRRNGDGILLPNKKESMD